MITLQFEFMKSSQLLGLSTFQFLAFFRRAIFYTFVIVYLRENMGLTITQVTLLGTIGMIANTVTQTLIWGNLLDRFHKPSLFISVGEMLAGVGHVFVFYWHRSEILKGNLLLGGFSIILGLAGIEVFWSMSNVGWSAIISDLTMEEERSQLMGLLSFIGGIGGLVGASIGGYLFLDGLGFSEGLLFYIPAGIMIFSGLLVVASIKQKDIDKTMKTINSLRPEEQGLKGHQIIHQKFREIPNSRLIVMFLIALILINFGRNSVILIIQLYLASHNGYNVSGEGLGFFRNVSSIAVMIWSIILNTHTLKNKEPQMFMIGIFSAILGFLWLIVAPSFELALISAFLIGSAQIVIQVTSYTLISSLIPPDWRGRIFSWYNATFMLSFGIAGTLITGPISDYMIYVLGTTDLQAYRVAFVAAIIIVVIGLLVYYPIGRTFRDNHRLAKNQAYNLS